MRVRIRKAQTGDIDGFDLSTFQAGLTYDVPASLATYLATVGAGDLVDSDVPALVVPLAEERIRATADRIRAVASDVGRSRTTSGTHVVPVPAPSKVQ